MSSSRSHLLADTEPVMSEMETVVAGVEYVRILQSIRILQNVDDTFYQIVYRQQGLGPALIMPVQNGLLGCVEPSERPYGVDT